jgi:8-oxo-dGTP pyrophosphatase MutT (NUDIX family)
MMGAGVIPFSTYNETVYFLFQKTFRSRKMGYLIDFGGGIDEGESYQQAAIREFVEETETLFLCENEDEIQIAQKTDSRISHQIDIMTSLFDKTLIKHPNNCCRRKPGHKIPPKDWKTFFIEVEYRDLTLINLQWEKDAESSTKSSNRFSKRRALHWVSAHDLLLIYKHNPKKLWKRVRQLEGATKVIQEIIEKSIAQL